MEVALKIDVDTHQGLAVGVPRLLKALEAEGVTATFFIAMGPDNSGRAIVRMFKNPGFLTKMRRTRALSMYGLRTVLSGTLLPARPTALACPQIVRELACSGFEVGVHGYDHVCWQDHIDELGEARIRGEIEEAFEAYRAILGESARSFAAPGWRTNAGALRLFDELPLDYHSDSRGQAPYRCAIDGEIFVTPEIPTTLPTMDELMGMRGFSATDAILDFYLKQFSAVTLNVHTIHAETEGMAHLETFRGLLRALRERGGLFVQLRDVASRLIAAELPVCELIRTTLTGRAGWVSAQGPEIAVAKATATL
jgi:undecaprenyl phosphate-alpha-L-ara4FN deformylase